MKTITLIFSIIFLGGCSTYMPQRYHISANNNTALKSLGVEGVYVKSFAGPEKINTICRITRHIAAPDKMSFDAYIQQALVDELKVAGLYDDKSPNVTLSGVVEPLNFSLGIFHGGTWNIGLRITSSNGKSIFIQERYEIDIGLTDTDDAACIHTADAFLSAVQNLIGKLVESPDFKSLVTPI